jgi:hypothetical protein
MNLMANSTSSGNLGTSIPAVSSTNHERIRLPSPPTPWVRPAAATASGSQVFVMPTIRLIVPCNTGKTAAEDEDELLATLSPFGRWRFIYQNNKFEFTFNLIALLVTIASAVYATLHLAPVILSEFALGAAAQEAQTRGSTTTDSLIAPSVLALMAIVLIWCLVTVSFSTRPRNVTYAKDTMKTIVGFIVGFLSGRKSP